MYWNFDYGSDSTHYGFHPVVHKMENQCGHAYLDVKHHSPMATHSTSPLSSPIHSPLVSPTHTKKPCRRVSFSAHSEVYHVPCRADYIDIMQSVWWTKHELSASSNQAAFTVRETMNKNPSLTLESAMCLLYQSTEMFSARIRLLIVNNDATEAALTRNRITAAQRANIWTVQCCSFDTAKRVIDRGAMCFDMILLTARMGNSDFHIAKELLTQFRSHCDHRVILGLSYHGYLDEPCKRALEDAHLDFLWSGPTPAKPLSMEHVQLRSLLALRDLRGRVDMADLQSPGTSPCVLGSNHTMFSCFSYPIGYKIVLHAPHHF